MDLDLGLLDEKQLQVFFRRNKTEMSCMDKPQIFLQQLRDHDLILEEKYQKMIRIKSIDKMKASVYELLDWIETKRPETIRRFWTYVFKDFIMTQYPSLKRLKDTLFDDQEDNLEEVPDERPRVGHNVFRVTCGALSGMLHKSRFASGRCGKSIRTEDRWLSPVEFVAQGSAAPDALWRRDIQWEGQPLSSLIERKMLVLHSEQCLCQLCQTDPQALEGQKNDDECFVCGSEGNLVMCDHCPRSFHPECHLPRVDPSTLEDDSAWMCTFCIWNMTEYRSQMKHEEHLVSNRLLQCHYLLLSLYNADKDHIFAKDPCIHQTDIKTPMWLDKITERLPDQHYTVGQLLTDIQLIFSNCDQFNQNKPEFRDMGIKLKEFYEQMVEKVFGGQ